MWMQSQYCKYCIYWWNTSNANEDLGYAVSILLRGIWKYCLLIQYIAQVVQLFPHIFIHVQWHALRTWLQLQCQICSSAQKVQIEWIRVLCKRNHHSLLLIICRTLQPNTRYCHLTLEHDGQDREVHGKRRMPEYPEPSSFQIALAILKFRVFHTPRMGNQSHDGQTFGTFVWNSLMQFISRAYTCKG